MYSVCIITKVDLMEVNELKVYSVKLVLHSVDKAGC